MVEITVRVKSVQIGHLLKCSYRSWVQALKRNAVFRRLGEVQYLEEQSQENFISGLFHQTSTPSDSNLSCSAQCFPICNCWPGISASKSLRFNWNTYLFFLPARRTSIRPGPRTRMMRILTSALFKWRWLRIPWTWSWRGRATMSLGGSTSSPSHS